MPPEIEIGHKTLPDLLRDLEIVSENKIRNQLRLVGVDAHKAAACDEAVRVEIREEIMRRFAAVAGVADVPEIVHRPGGVMEAFVALYDAGGSGWDVKCIACEIGRGEHTCSLSKEEGQ